MPDVTIKKINGEYYKLTDTIFPENPTSEELRTYCIENENKCAIGCHYYCNDECQAGRFQIEKHTPSVALMAKDYSKSKVENISKHIKNQSLIEWMKEEIETAYLQGYYEKDYYGTNKKTV
ncbi:hypothetical protein AALK14_08390 [Butyricimonas hominis]|uniref:hypothetical protein n=1 Tax=Butyricimonas hominis TaxID=2763032 RepID=UPI003517C708